MTEKQDEGVSREDAIAMLQRDVRTWKSYRRERWGWHPDLRGENRYADLNGAG